MGEQKHHRVAIDAQGNTVRVIEWHGDHGTAHLHDDADLKDPHFYSYLTLEDEKTRLLLQPDNRTLIEPTSGKKYTLQQ